MNLIVKRRVGIFLFFCTVFISGCMRFTERDYDLQEQAYQKERQAQEMRDKERFQYRW